MAPSRDALCHRTYLQILWGDIHVPIWSRALPLVRLRETLFPWVSSELLHAKAMSLPADSSREKWTVVSHPPPLLFPLIDFRTFIFPVSWGVACSGLFLLSVLLRGYLILVSESTITYVVLTAKEILSASSSVLRAVLLFPAAYYWTFLPGSLLSVSARNYPKPNSLPFLP